MAYNQTVNQYGKIVPPYIKKAQTSKKREVYGLNFPIGSESRGGFFSKKSGTDMIKNSVKQLLTTERGERLMLPSYGCNLRRFLFQPLDEITFEAIKTDILTSFNRYIVGASIKKLAVFPSEDISPAGSNGLSVILTLKLDTEELEVFEVEVNIS